MQQKLVVDPNYVPNMTGLLRERIIFCIIKKYKYDILVCILTETQIILKQYIYSHICYHFNLHIIEYVFT